MKLLITGAWGNLGVMCVEQALTDGHQLRCFDLPGQANQHIAQHYQQRYPGRIETVWGDISRLPDNAAFSIIYSIRI